MIPRTPSHADKLTAVEHLLGLSLRVLNGSRVLSSYASLFSCLHENPYVQGVIETILTHVIACEKESAGSSRAMLETARETLVSERRPVVMSQFLSRRPRKRDIELAIDTASSDRVVNSLVKTLFTTCGKNCTVFVKESNDGRLTLELTNGHLFKTVPALPIRTTLSGVRIACIDGRVETVSEIDQFLTEVSDSRDKCLLFARSFHEDVLNTLRVNLEANRLSVYPINVPMEPEEINTLVDVSALTGARVVCSLSGDTLNSLRLQDTGFVNAVILSADSVALSGSTDTRASHAVIDSLKHRISEETVDFKKKLLSDRLIRLTSYHAIVRVSTEEQQDNLDAALRAANAVLRYGVNERGQRLDVIASATKYALMTV